MDSPNFTRFYQVKEKVNSVSRQFPFMICKNEGIIVITEDNKPVAALVPLKDMDKESVALSTNQEFLEIIEKARHEFESGKKISLEEMKQALFE